MEIFPFSRKGSIDWTLKVVIIVGKTIGTRRNLPKAKFAERKKSSPAIANAKTNFLVLIGRKIV